MRYNFVVQKKNLVGQYFTCYKAIFKYETTTNFDNKYNNENSKKKK